MIGRPWDGEAKLAVVGGGTMGAGIAALACESGVDTVLCEVDEGAATAAEERIEGLLRRRLERGRLDLAGLEAARGRLRVSPSLDAAAPATLAVEAVPEILDLKRDLLARLARIAPDAVLATNTSSLPIAEVVGDADFASRALGMHFFNPPGAIRLVELVSTPATDPTAAATARTLAERLGRRAVAVADGPGFLVNRCARPYYLEALRIVAAGDATYVEVDAACEADGFPMGPFRLMDLIGIDVSLSVTRSMWELAEREPRWEPSPIQERLVAEGRLGQKAGGGFYDRDGSPLGIPDGLLVGPGGPAPSAAAIRARLAAQIVNEAWFALDAGVAAVTDVDPAMTGALRWPRGPLAWGQELGLAAVVAELERLAAAADDDAVYRVAAGLRAAAGA